MQAGVEPGPTRVAIVATHPIQYHDPWFCQLAANPDLDVGCNTPEIFDALRGWRPQVAILTGWHSLMMVQALWACVRLRIPRIVRGESNALRPRPAVKRAGHRALLRFFDRFLAIGEANRTFYANAGVPEDRIFPCPYFVDNERFAARAAELEPERVRLRAEWRIPERAFCLLFAGKLVPKKAPLDLLRAIARARGHGASVHLLVVGTGELMGEAKALAASESLPVSFAGFLNQSDIPKAYVAADCLVLPSEAGETWGLVVNEAMACGIPAIVSDRVGCGPDLVTEGRTGAVFPFGDIDALARKMTNFASDAGRVKALGEAARHRVKTDYSVDRAVAGTLAAIRSAVER
jgi:glycosyltransferase involved in cell wall biosynthesis